MRHSALYLVMLFIGTAASAQNITFPHDGLNRQYRIHFPDQVAENAPLILAPVSYTHLTLPTILRV